MSISDINKGASGVNPTADSILPSQTGNSGKVLKTDGVNASWDVYSPSSIVQVVSYQTGAVATGTTPIPFDDTIPQITEGDQYMSLTITPTNASNKLLITVKANLANSAGGFGVVAALFQDSTSNALAVGVIYNPVVNMISPAYIQYYMTASTTSATTFKVRGGSEQIGTTTFNGTIGSRKYGGTLISSITITEIKS